MIVIDVSSIADIPFECSQNAIVRDAEAEIETQLMVAEILPSDSKYSSVSIICSSFIHAR